jgi:hypothetical protein
VPLKRSSSVDAAYNAVELLALLQLKGHLDGIEMSSWQSGTSLAELFDALAELGDGAWLEGRFPGAPQERATRWLQAFLSGDEVPARIDPAPIAKTEDDPGDRHEAKRSDARETLLEYTRFLPADSRQALAMRLDTDRAFYESCLSLMGEFGEIFAWCAAMPERDFGNYRPSLSASLADQDVAQMARFFLVENAEGFAAIFDPHSAGYRDQTVERAASVFETMLRAASPAPIERSKNQAPDGDKEKFSGNSAGRPARKRAAKSVSSKR